MTNDKQRERLVELLKEADIKRNKYVQKENKSGNFPTMKEVRSFEAGYLIANGVIVPPCKVNTFVYFFSRYEVKQGYIRNITIDKSGTKIAVCYDGIRFKIFEPCDFGKTVFLTKEEAEKALKGGAE